MTVVVFYLPIFGRRNKFRAAWHTLVCKYFLNTDASVCWVKTYTSEVPGPNEYCNFQLLNSYE
jgi:hypothetical protein